MAIPSTFTTALLLAIFTMVCWGSWANTLKMSGKWRFELFCYDFAFGVLLCAFVTTATFGTYGSEITTMDNLAIVRKLQIFWGVMAGGLFALANMLLVGAISISGMAVAFPIGIGLALIIGVVWNYILKPQGDPIFLFSGVAVVALAIIVTAWAHKTANPGGPPRPVRKPTAAPLPPPEPSALKGILLSVAAGLLMGAFYPMVEMGKQGDIEMGPYPIGLMFAIGMFLMTFLFNLYFLNLPVQGRPLSFSDYFKGTRRQHLLGIGGGAIWYAGTISNFVAASTPPEVNLGPAISYALGQGASMVSTLWGLLLWKEFAKAPSKAKSLIWAAVLIFACGLGLVSMAPLR
jgi:glucose uptake protein